MDWRKSWAYENIYGKKNNGECTKRSLLPDERSIWDDYLDLAALNLIPGQISISPINGYTMEQLSGLLKTPVEVINRANKKLQEMGSISIENTGVIVILKWKDYQTDWERTRTYTDNPTTEPTSKPTRQIRLDKNRIDRYKRKEYIDIYICFLDCWNSKKIIQHKYLTDACYGHLNARLDNGYTEKDILQAIKNYAHILSEPRYFWKYKWTLDEFITRGLDKFMDLNIAKQNYLDKNYKPEDTEEEKKLKMELKGG